MQPNRIVTRCDTKCHIEGVGMGKIDYLCCLSGPKSDQRVQAPQMPVGGAFQGSRPLEIERIRCREDD